MNYHGTKIEQNFFCNYDSKIYTAQSASNSHGILFDQAVSMENIGKMCQKIIDNKVQEINHKLFDLCLKSVSTNIKHLELVDKIKTAMLNS